MGVEEFEVFKGSPPSDRESALGQPPAVDGQYALRQESEYVLPQSDERDCFRLCFASFCRVSELNWGASKYVSRLGFPGEVAVGGGYSSGVNSQVHVLVRRFP
jgi:hypothetical protein